MMSTATANTHFGTINLKKCMYHYMTPLKQTPCLKIYVLYAF